jgi:hypothetical protein
MLGDMFRCVPGRVLVLWLVVAAIITIPAWLGITRPGAATTARRFIGHCVLGGAAAGVVLSLVVWLAYPHASPAHSLLSWPVIGAIAGAEVGLLAVIARTIAVRLGAR